jgi:hypothetical protein
MEHGATLLHAVVGRLTAAAGSSSGGALVEQGREEEEEEDAGLHIIDILIDAGADPDARAANGSTPLHWWVVCILLIVRKRKGWIQLTRTPQQTGPPATGAPAPSAASCCVAPTHTSAQTPGAAA